MDWSGDMQNAGMELLSVHGCRKPTANDRAEYGPHRDALSLREARSGSNAANHAAKEPAGFKGSL